MKKYIVTIAPPTPNGDLHLGHLSGPILSADVFARIKRAQGHEVVFVCYSDDYQSYVQRKAIQLDSTWQDVSRNYSQRIENTLKAVDVDLNWFLKSQDNPFFNNAVKEFYEGVKANNKVITKKELAPYSEEENLWGFEAFARATCNYCGEESDASQCEACANTPDISEMGTFTSIFTKKEMGWKEIEREYLQIAEFYPYLKEKYSLMKLRGRSNNLIKSIINSEVEDWCFDRKEESGIDIESEGKTTRISTWFSGIAGYVAAIKEWADNMGTPEKASEFLEDHSTQIIHFLGFDCSYSHGIVYPALLASVPKYTSNSRIITNEFLKLENGDFSTSRGHAIWIDEMLEKHDVSRVRFYIALNAPETHVSNFEMESYLNWEENFNKTLDLVSNVIKNHSSKKHKGYDQAIHESTVNYFKNAIAEISNQESFSVKKMAKYCEEFLNYINETCFRDKESVYTLFQEYLIMAEPIHPSLSNEVLTNHFKNILEFA